MSDTSDTAQTGAPRRFRFSIGAMLLWMVIAYLAANNVVTSRRVAIMKRELESQNRELSTHRPLAATEVARQFEKNATISPISVTVKDVRYSPDSDSYKVEFSWTDTSTNQSWSADVKLISDGYGSYYCQIRNGPFITPLGNKESFTVMVRSPSPLADWHSERPTNKALNVRTGNGLMTSGWESRRSNS